MDQAKVAEVLRASWRGDGPIIPSSDGKGLVFKSRFTPGLLTAEDVKLDEGDRIEYLLGSGKTVAAEVRSGYRRHSNGCYGYECLFDDLDGLQFADERRIVSWPGKVP